MCKAFYPHVYIPLTNCWKCFCLWNLIAETSWLFTTFISLNFSKQSMMKSDYCWTINAIQNFTFQVSLSFSVFFSSMSIFRIVFSWFFHSLLSFWVLLGCACLEAQHRNVYVYCVLCDAFCARVKLYHNINWMLVSNCILIVRIECFLHSTLLLLYMCLGKSELA